MERSKPDFGGSGVLYNIVQCFLGCEIEVMPDTGTDRWVRRKVPHFQVAAEPGATAVIPDEVADEKREILDRILGGIHRPDDLVESPRHEVDMAGASLVEAADVFYRAKWVSVSGTGMLQLAQVARGLWWDFKCSSAGGAASA